MAHGLWPSLAQMQRLCSYGPWPMAFTRPAAETSEVLRAAVIDAMLEVYAVHPLNYYALQAHTG